MTSSEIHNIRILFVEDSELDYELMLAALARDLIALEGTRVEDAEAMQAALKSSSWDAVISDHNLPNFSSGGALQVLRESALDLPFLVVSGETGEEVAVEAMLAGADDYIMKSRLSRLAPALRRSLQAAAVRRERSAAETALRLSEARLHELASHLESVKEIERTSVATEISEEIGSALTGLKFELAWLQRHLTLAPDVAERLASAIALVDGTASTTQRVVGNLRPAVLDQGIVPALAWLTTQFAKRSAVEMHFDANRDEVLDPDTSIGIYRVCQEALDNVALCIGVTRVNVHLFATEDQIHLEVASNGEASVPPESGAPNFALARMQERARGLDGTLEISSTREQGTTVLLSLPRLRGGPEVNSP